MKNVNELNYNTLGLSKETIKLIENIDPKDLITLSFKFEPIPGISKIRCKKITNALIEAGFLPNLPFDKDGDVDFLCEVLGVSPKELYEKYDIVERHSPIRGVTRFLEDVFGPNADFLNYGSREFYTEQRLSQLLEIIGTLTPREATIIKMRFGLDGEGTKLLEEVSKVFDISPQRVRQIEAKALRKLRHPSRAKRLIAWFFNDPDGNNLAVINKRIAKLKQTPAYQEYEQLSKWREYATNTQPNNARYLENTELSVRAFNCLKRAGINTTAELARMTDEDLRKVRNLGEGCIAEIREKFPAPKA